MGRRYIEWDFDKGVVVEYKRHGECNRCGDCCVALIQFTIDGRYSPLLKTRIAATSTEDKKAVDNAPNVWIELKADDKRYLHKMLEIDVEHKQPCGKLIIEDGVASCKIQFDKDVFHKEWPMSPQHVTPFPRCSYSFEKVKEWKF